MSTPPSPVNPNLPPDHVTVFIDGVEMATPRNSMIIHAADKAGIPIPRFCYHDKLPIAANCRMCLVEAEMGGRMSPKPLPACATPVADGMKVFTRSEKALKSQRNVMEFLLINHPLDCPICDQGGECELQDVSMGYGRGISRYSEKKRVVADEDMGPLVATEMTRCIQCTRCVRFTADIAGTYELGGMQRGENLQIGTFDGQPLMTELSGNVIDVCPVGALTNKVFQFKARPWELTAKDSLGFQDALGSNLFLHARRGDVMRAVPRDNESVNECWLSDRDRFAHQGMYAEDRALVPMIRVGEGNEASDFREASWDEALGLAAQILRDHAGDALGVLVHPATSNEEGVLLARLAASLETGNLDHRLSQHDVSDAAIAEVSGVPVEDIAHADAIVIVGSHLRHEVPLLHHRVRQAWKRGAKVFSVNPVAFDVAFDIAGKAIVPPSQIADALAALDIGQAERAVVIVGGVAENSVHASAIRKAATDFAAKTGARLCRIPQGANAVGLSQLGVLPSQRPTQDMLREARQAYVLYGIEPGLDFADQGVAMRALAGAKTIAFSHYACRSIRSVADVILPIALLPELEASMTNMDGAVQRTQAAGKMRGDVREGWRVLRALGAALFADGFGFTDLAGLRASIAPRAVDVRGGNVALAGAPGIELAVSQAIYRSDATVRRASALQAHPLTVGPRAVLNPETAASVGLADGMMGKFSTAAGTAALPVALSEKVSAGVVWVESGYGATAPLAASRVEVRSA